MDKMENPEQVRVSFYKLVNEIRRGYTIDMPLNTQSPRITSLRKFTDNFVVEYMDSKQNVCMLHIDNSVFLAELEQIFENYQNKYQEYLFKYQEYNMDYYSQRAKTYLSIASRCVAILKYITMPIEESKTIEKDKRREFIGIYVSKAFPSITYEVNREYSNIFSDKKNENKIKTMITKANDGTLFGDETIPFLDDESNKDLIQL